jgi:hypothetical protein
MGSVERVLYGSVPRGFICSKEKLEADAGLSCAE